MVRTIIKKTKFAIHKQKMKQLEDADFFTKQEKLTKNLQENMKKLKESFGYGHDVKTHRVMFGKNKAYVAELIYIEGLADTKFISNSVLRALIESNIDFEKDAEEGFVEAIKTKVLATSDIDEVIDYSSVIDNCLGGNTVLMIEGQSEALAISTTGYATRSITEPQSETVVRGPREGFTESIKVNVGLIRRKIKSNKLRVDHIVIGEKTKTDVMLMYLEGVVKPEIIKTVKQRLKGIKTDSILESGYIEQYIEDAPFSPFATISYTEKPDVASGKILEGRVAIVVDGTPFVLTAPMLFVESFQTSEDYFSRPYQATINRMLRILGYFISVFLPGLYIALTSFHQELIPTTLLLTIADAREGTPFPVFFEALIMVFAFDILREAGIRLPRAVGQAISIVGALIMGDAAVSAGLVGAPMVITIALTAVATFLVPAQSDATTFLRPIMMILGATLGFYGILMGALLLLTHICNLTSFGVPFFDGFSYSMDLQDSFVRMPLWFMKRRPKDLAGKDKHRRKFFTVPSKHGKDLKKEVRIDEKF